MRATDSVPTLDALVRIRQRGTRSVNVERDIGQYDVAEGYVLTAQVRQSLSRILERIDGPGAVRAWTLTGPYGSGKSYFGIFLMNLLSAASTAHEVAIAQLRAVDPPLAESMSSIVAGQGGAGLMPIAITGYRTTIQTCIRQGLRRSLKAHKADERIQTWLSQPEFWADELESRSIVNALKALLDIVSTPTFGFKGILLILDEMGKPLEYATAHPNESDLYLLQEIAEFANHNAATPLLFVGILHQSFDRYAGHADGLSQREWAKIQGRFEDIAFQEPPNQQLWLLANALEYSDNVNELEAAWPDARQVAQFAVDYELYPPTLRRDDFVSLCERTLPFHPSAMTALPYIFRRLAQNERSMFAYLTSLEPRGFQEYLALQSPPARIRLADLFDYLAANFQGRLYSSLRARPLTETLEKIESNTQLESIAADAIKTIGLLNWLAEVGPFRATEESVLFALRSSEQTDDQIRHVLGQLVRQSAIVFRRFNQTYVIWQGSDVDIDERIDAARQRQLGGFSVAQAVQQYVPPQPVIARRHSYRTGTTRFFDVHYVDIQKKELAAYAPSHGASGVILVCLAASEGEINEFGRWATEAPCRFRNDLLIGILTRTPHLVEMLKEIHCLHWVRDNTPELRDDAVARRELRTRLNELETWVRNELDSALRVHSLHKTHRCRWYYQGADVSETALRGLSYLVSHACDLLFDASPIIRNEILNRRLISSQGSAARRNLIEAMLTRAEAPRLGIEGFPPERSMYESLLRAGELHYQVTEERWDFQAPTETDPLELRRVWDAIRAYVFALPPQPRSVQALFEILSKTPFGLTDGVEPVLFCAFMIVHQDETTLYNEGSLLPMPEVADWEVLLRRPELFAVAGCRVVGPRAAVVNRLARGLQTNPAAMPIVRELIRRVKRLPEHVLRTQRLSPMTLATRRAMDTARSPESLLFQELPSALGIQPFGETEDAEPMQVERFFTNLNAALQELSSVMPKLLSEARDRLLEACGLPATEEGWAQFMELAAELATRTNQPTLAPLLHRAGSGADARAALESTLAYVLNRPPRAWSDYDREQFLVRAQAYGEQFRRERNGYAAVSGLTAAQRERSQRLVAQLRRQLQSELDDDTLVVRAAMQTLLDELQKADLTAGNGMSLHE